MRPEYIFAASLVIAALALPVGILVTTGDILPAIGGGGSRTAPAAGGDATPLTLATAPIVVPSGVSAGYRAVVATLDLPGESTADAVCRHHARLADRVQLYLQDSDEPPPTAATGHDARLAWLIAEILPEAVAEAAGRPAKELVDGAALMPSTALSRSGHDRPLYACTGADARPLATR